MDEVLIQLGGGRNRDFWERGKLPNPLPLLPDEEKQFLRDKGPAEVPPEVVVAENAFQFFGWRTRRYVHFVVGGDGIECVVAQVFKGRTVELIAPATGHHID